MIDLEAIRAAVVDDDRGDNGVACVGCEHCDCAIEHARDKAVISALLAEVERLTGEME